MADSKIPDQSVLVRAEPTYYQIWPALAVGVGLSLTTVWVCFLGYELAKLILAAI